MRILKFIQVIGLFAIGATALPVSVSSAIQERDIQHQPTIRECQAHRINTGVQAFGKALHKRNEEPVKIDKKGGQYCTDCRKYFWTTIELQDHHNKNDCK
ncbi:hypothetical protein PspLS_11794 [Pyricularia sp. CBS 133598]|nr:hypothetical protein PspLS_11794 [Pyricularia sp. CBS 133598]